MEKYNYKGIKQNKPETLSKLIKEVKKLYKLEPYSRERYKQFHIIKELEQNLNVKVCSNSPNIKNKIINIEIMKKNKNGLYDVIVNFTIKDIKIEI